MAKRGRGAGGSKLERQGQHKFQDREAETMEGKTVQEQKCIEKTAKARYIIMCGGSNSERERERGTISKRFLYLVSIKVTTAETMFPDPAM